MGVVETFFRAIEVLRCLIDKFAERIPCCLLLA